MHSFLGGADGTELMRTWKLRDSSKVIEKIKHMLLSERTGAEWELLEENEWEDENPLTIQVSKATGFETDADPVLLKATGRGGGRNNLPSIVNTVTVLGAGDNSEEDKLRGTSGWTKLKSRTLS